MMVKRLVLRVVAVLVLREVLVSDVWTRGAAVQYTG